MPRPSDVPARFSAPSRVHLSPERGGPRGPSGHPRGSRTRAVGRRKCVPSTPGTGGYSGRVRGLRELEVWAPGRVPPTLTAGTFAHLGVPERARAVVDDPLRASALGVHAAEGLAFGAKVSDVATQAAGGQFGCEARAHGEILLLPGSGGSLRRGVGVRPG